MRLSLLITTYERPDALAAVLESVRAQTQAPDEVIIADDGSGTETARLVRTAAGLAPYPVRHVWQPHDGWRLCRIRNLGVLASSGDYLVCLDGDMVLDRYALADHRRFARSGSWVQGCRLPLDAARTQDVLDGSWTPQGALSRGLSAKRRLQALRLPLAAKAVGPLADRLLAVKGCHQAYWRSDLFRVNGWDESIVGWGPEDKDLAARLAHAGVARRTLLWGGLAWHLDHPPADRSRVPMNREVLDTTLAHRRVVAPRGLRQHQQVPAAASA